MMMSKARELASKARDKVFGKQDKAGQE